MEETLTKENAKKAMEIKGEVRGYSMGAYGGAVLEREGEEGLKRLEDKMAELGYPIKYRKANQPSFYPIGMEYLTLLAIKDIFKYDDNEFQEIGRVQPKHSFLIRIIMEFISAEKAAGQAESMWRKHYTVGNLKIIELNEEKKYLILRVENFRLHPLNCHILRGYFSSVAKFVVKGPVACEETKCLFQGNKYHEFLLKW